MELKISCNINNLGREASDDEIQLLAPLLIDIIRDLFLPLSEEKTVDD